MSLALESTRVAALFNAEGRRLLELRTRAGKFIRRRMLGAGADDLAMSGRWLVYRVGATIRAIDTSRWSDTVLTAARGTVVGLSVEGRRVAWGEQRTGTDVIRAITLPRI